MIDITAILTSPLLQVSLVGSAMALVFFVTDYRGATTRAFTLWLFAMSASCAVATFDGYGGKGTSLLGNLLLNGFETVAILAVIEWGRRIGKLVPGRISRITDWMFRFSQMLYLGYGLFIFGFFLFFTDEALQMPSGLLRPRPGSYALFIPIISICVGISGLAIILLRFMRLDRAEAARLDSLFIAGPFLVLGIIFSEAWVAVPLMLGLLAALTGAVRHLTILNRRGAFMQQFLSPQIARMVRQQGVSAVLARERRVVSVVACDLRGFTAYARRRNSNTVTNLLERYYALVGDITAQYNGMVKDHAGDGVLILVGAPLPIADHAERAARLAIALQGPVQALISKADKSLGFGIGIATGNATLGAIRGAGRLEYVAVGNPVNLASRLCSRALDGEILADVRTCRGIDQALPLTVEERPPEPLKGFAEPIPVRALLPKLESASASPPPETATTAT